jgi:nucleoside 2-deoxyribosyltransferase
MKIYLAGPLFTSAERHWNVLLARAIEHHGIEVWLPQEHEPREFNAREIFETDVLGIDSSDVVVAIMDGADPDSGTCWEVGYAYAKLRPIILIRTDFRKCGEDNVTPYNIMLSESATIHKEIPFATIEQTANMIVDCLYVRQLPNDCETIT